MLVALASVCESLSGMCQSPDCLAASLGHSQAEVTNAWVYLRLWALSLGEVSMLTRLQGVLGCLH